MSDLMREEFEAACEARFNWSLQDPFRDKGEVTLSSWDGEQYGNRIVQGMWWAWQASRESLVVELPLIHRDDYANRFGMNCAVEAVDMMKSRIHAAGVKTK